jgi:hypothetical protein
LGTLLESQRENFSKIITIAGQMEKNGPQYTHIEDLKEIAKACNLDGIHLKLAKNEPESTSAFQVRNAALLLMTQALVDPQTHPQTTLRIGRTLIELGFSPEIKGKISDLMSLLVNNCNTDGCMIACASLPRTPTKITKLALSVLGGIGEAKALESYGCNKGMPKFVRMTCVYKLTQKADNPGNDFALDFLQALESIESSRGAENSDNSVPNSARAELRRILPKYNPMLIGSLAALPDPADTKIAISTIRKKRVAKQASKNTTPKSRLKSVPKAESHTKDKKAKLKA